MKTTRFTHHVLHGKQSVNVQQISPPIVRTVHVFVGRRVEHGVEMEPRHCHLDDAQNEEIRCGESAETFRYTYFFVNKITP